MAKSVTLAECESLVGKSVIKVSGKPFKSGLKANVVRAVTVNPHTDRLAFTFFDDDSIVDAWKVKVLEPD